MDFMSIAIYVVIFFFFLLSLGAMLIGLPGNWMILVLTVIFGFISDWAVISFTETAVLGGLLLLGELMETLVALKGANKYKPSKWAYVATVVGAIVGAIVGTGVVPLVGSVIGAAVGVFGFTYLVESYVSGYSEQAEKVAKSAMIGSLIGMCVKFTIAFGVICYMFWKLISSYAPIASIGMMLF